MAGWKGHLPPDEPCCHGAASLTCAYDMSLLAGDVDTSAESAATESTTTEGGDSSG